MVQYQLSVQKPLHLVRDAGFGAFPVAPGVPEYRPLRDAQFLQPRSALVHIFVMPQVLQMVLGSNAMVLHIIGPFLFL